MDPFKAEQIAPGAGGAGAPVRVRATEQIKVVPETVEETKVEEGAEIMEQQFNEAEIAYEIETDRNLTYLERRAKLRSEFLRCVTSNWPWVFTLGTFAVGLPIAIKTSKNFIKTLIQMNISSILEHKILTLNTNI